MKQRSADLAFLAAAALLCWNGVRWAFQRPTFLWADEIQNLPSDPHWTYLELFHLLPQRLYNDRPFGFALERVLYQTYGFDYIPQLACFLVLHFLNCGLIYAISRRLGVSRPLALAGAGLFGALCTTAQTATYLGASFDVLATFFLLGSIYTILLDKDWTKYLSAVLFLCALRSKEFAIVNPVILTLLLASQQKLRAVLARLWPHYLILIVFASRYLYFLTRMRAEIPAGNPYYMDFRPATILQSISYYVSLVFERDNSQPWLTAAILLTLAIYGIVRRHFLLLTALAAFVLVILPVSTLATRAPYYVYCPQVFLILAICLLVDDALRLAFRGEPARSLAIAAAAILILSGGLALRSSIYFRNRVRFAWIVRDACAHSASDIGAKLAAIGPGSHIYLNHGSEAPYLWTAGPCHYLQVLHHDDSIACIIGKPSAELNQLYDQDTAEKYWVDYARGGWLTVGKK